MSCHFMSWPNWVILVNLLTITEYHVKLWLVKKVYDDLMIINLFFEIHLKLNIVPSNLKFSDTFQWPSLFYDFLFSQKLLNMGLRGTVQ